MCWLAKNIADEVNRQRVGRCEIMGAIGGQLGVRQPSPDGRRLLLFIFLEQLRATWALEGISRGATATALSVLETLRVKGDIGN